MTNAKALKLLKYLNKYGDTTEWTEENIFDPAKIKTHISPDDENAVFALVFDDGYLYDIFYSMQRKSLISIWALENGFDIEQTNSWNCSFYRRQE